MIGSAIRPDLPYLTGEDSHIWRFGVCLLMTKVPWRPSRSVSTPCCGPGDTVAGCFGASVTCKDVWWTGSALHRATGSRLMRLNLIACLLVLMPGLSHSLAMPPSTAPTDGSPPKVALPPHQAHFTNPKAPHPQHQPQRRPHMAPRHAPALPGRQPTDPHPGFLVVPYK